MYKSKIRISKMRNGASRSKGGHDKLGTKGSGLNQRLIDEGPILVEVVGQLPLECLGGR